MDYSRRQLARTIPSSKEVLQNKLNFYRNLFCFFAGFLTCLLWVALWS
jgi:hypothetical protein